MAPRGRWRRCSPAPELAHYAAGWPAPGDLGVVAVDDGGERLGAAWLRLLGSVDPGYGWVDDATPELTIGVAAGRRRQGIGGALIEALLVAARGAGIAAVSLSVEPDNHAAGLYERHGFAVVGRNGGSLTMLCRL